MESRITGTTQLMGLIGTPVGHSGSPAMYNYCFEKMGLDYAYLAFDIDIPQVEEMLRAARLLHMKALNVTMPCKQAVLPYMDELSDAARLIGACNMILFDGNKTKGYNTDGIGFVENLKAHGVEVKDKRIVIVGAGGAGVAVMVQCALDGAAKITVFNHKTKFFQRGEDKARLLREEVPECEIEVHDLDDTEYYHDAIRKGDIFINASRAGMAPQDDTTVIEDTSVFREDLVVADVVYNPRETKLMRQAREGGCEHVIGGIGMLTRQGAENFRLFTGGLVMPVEEIEEKFFQPDED